MTAPLVSIIIPSKDGDRNGNVKKLLSDIAAQNIKDIEVIVVIGASPNGHARNVGARHAKGEFLVMLDDDLRLAEKDFLQNLLEGLTKNANIGMAGASQQIPPDSNKFQQRAALELPRSQFPVVAEPTETDMVNHCAGFAIKASLYHSVGGESNILLRGTDPDLRYKVNKAGYRIVVVPNTKSYHPLPENWNKFWSYHWKCGFDTALVFRRHKDKIVDISHGVEPVTDYLIPTWQRTIRFLSRTIGSLLQIKWLLFVSYLAYGGGFLWGLVFSKENPISDGTVQVYSYTDL